MTRLQIAFILTKYVWPGVTGLVKKSIGLCVEEIKKPKSICETLYLNAICLELPDLTRIELTRIELIRIELTHHIYGFFKGCVSASL